MSAVDGTDRDAEAGVTEERRDDGGQPATDEREMTTRGMLTRVLAGESRNALARIELAASELARNELPPGLLGRVCAIRAAVDELDVLLGKVDLLADVERVPDRAEVDLAASARTVVERLAPSLRARGVGIDWAGPASGQSRLCVATACARVDVLCLGLTRLVAGAVGVDGIDTACDAGSEDATVAFDVIRRDDDVCVVARCDTPRPGPRFDRAMRIRFAIT